MAARGEKIEALTSAQEERLRQFRAEMFAAGTCTLPADRARAEDAFARACRAIGREPVPVIWVDSPMTAQLALHALKQLSLREGVDSLGDSLRDSLGDSLWASLGDSLWASLRDSLWDSLGDSLWASLRASKIEYQPTWWWGQQDLYWVAFYEFAAEIGVTYSPDAAAKLQIMRDIGESCGWWWPRDGLIIASERPSVVAMNQRERLHSTSGPAVQFRDGWGVYAVNGVRVPEFVVMRPEEITVAAIEAEQNQEVRRVMTERYCHGQEVSGAAAYIRDCGAEVVDHDNAYGTLRRKRREGDTDLLMVEVINSTAEPDGRFKHYWLRVHPELRPMLPEGGLGEPQKLTARNAVASTFGLRGEAYEVGAQS